MVVFESDFVITVTVTTPTCVMPPANFVYFIHYRSVHVGNVGQAGADGTEPALCEPSDNWFAVTARLLPTATAQVSPAQQLAGLPAFHQVTSPGTLLANLVHWFHWKKMELIISSG